MSEAKDYSVSLRWDEDDEEYVAVCNEMPGVVAGDSDPGRAVTQAVLCIEEALETLRELDITPVAPWNKLWSAFLDGRWQREVPSQTGSYFRADYKGNIEVGRGIVYLHEGELKAVDNWGAWWWSVPIPSLPPTPPWEE